MTTGGKLESSNYVGPNVEQSSVVDNDPDVQAAALAAMGLPLVMLTGNDISAADANSALINTAIDAAESVYSSPKIYISAPRGSTAYIAATAGNTIRWSCAQLVFIGGWTLKSGNTSASGDPIPMFRNKAFINRLTGYKVISSMTFSATTGLVTVNCTGHGKSVGDDACIWGANQHGYNGIHRVHSVTNANTYTFRADDPPTVTTATASDYLRDTQGAGELRQIASIDVGGSLDVYCRVDFNGQYAAVAGHAGNASGTNGTNASVPSTNNGFDFDICSLMFTKNFSVNFWWPAINSREHQLVVVHSKDFKSDTLLVGSAGADGIHFTGPIQGAQIGLVAGSSIDNLLAIGTSDYWTGNGQMPMNLSEGAITGFKCRQLRADNCGYDAFRVIGESQYPIDFEIENISGCVQSTGYVSHMMYDNVMPQGGNVWIRKGRIGRSDAVTQNVTRHGLGAYIVGNMYYGPDAPMGTQNSEALLLNQPSGATGGTVEFEGAVSTQSQTTLRYGTVVYNNSNANAVLDRLVIRRPYFRRPDITGATTSSGMLYDAGTTATIKHIEIIEPDTDGGSVALWRVNNTAVTKVDVINPQIGEANRIGIQGSSSNATCVASLIGGRVGMNTAGNKLFESQASGTTLFEIRGGGCYVPGCEAANVSVFGKSASQVGKIYNWDLFEDVRSGVTQLTITAGQFCSSNVGGINDASFRYGPCIGNKGGHFWALGTSATGTNVDIG